MCACACVCVRVGMSKMFEKLICNDTSSISHFPLKNVITDKKKQLCITMKQNIFHFTVNLRIWTFVVICCYAVMNSSKSFLITIYEHKRLFYSLVIFEYLSSCAFIRTGVWYYMYGTYVRIFQSSKKIIYLSVLLKFWINWKKYCLNISLLIKKCTSIKLYIYRYVKWWDV